MDKFNLIAYSFPYFRFNNKIRKVIKYSASRVLFSFYSLIGYMTGLKHNVYNNDSADY